MKHIPPHIKEKINKLTGELKKIYELAEQTWEGCDGCDENDKNFWMNGFQTGYNMKSAEQMPIELTYEERVRWFVNNYYETGMEYASMLESMKNDDLDNFVWYGETIRIPKFYSGNEILYTEEQVRKAINMCHQYIFGYNLIESKIIEIIQSLKQPKKQSHKRINIEEMPKEERDSLRNKAYKHFDIDSSETDWIKYTEKDMRAAFQAGNRYGKSDSKPYRTMHWERFIEVYNETLETNKNK
jgi:hypothetical protein